MHESPSVHFLFVGMCQYFPMTNQIPLSSVAALKRSTWYTICVKVFSILKTIAVYSSSIPNSQAFFFCKLDRVCRTHQNMSLIAPKKSAYCKSTWSGDHLYLQWINMCTENFCRSIYTWNQNKPLRSRSMKQNADFQEGV